MIESAHITYVIIIFYLIDYQKPFAMVTLTQKELVVHDLLDSRYIYTCVSISLTPSLPSFPKFDIPFMFNMQTSPVTTIKYYGNCPDDFIALLHSVQSKMPHDIRSTKVWHATHYNIILLFYLALAFGRW